jgi:hypothetical protein
MRFDRYPGKTLGRDGKPSKQRLTAAKKSLQRQRDKTPLFAAEIASEQPTPEERIAELDRNAEAWLDGMRALVAKSWRDSRAKLRSLPADQAFAILAEWQYGYLPGSQEYLADLIRQRTNGHEASDFIKQQIANWLAGGEAYRAGRRPKMNG